jgi:hypothetical protein
VRVYDASGKLVRSLVQASAGPAGDLQVSSLVFNADGTALLYISAQGLTLAWDGRDDSGEAVVSGDYTVQITVQLPGGGIYQSQKVVAVSAQRGTALANAHLWPNPASDQVTLSCMAPLGTGLRIRLYNLAGEQIFENSTVLGSVPPSLRLRSSSGQSLASGIYIVAIEARTPGSAGPERRWFKIAIQTP